MQFMSKFFNSSLGILFDRLINYMLYNKCNAKD